MKFIFKIIFFLIILIILIFKYQLIIVNFITAKIYRWYYKIWYYEQTKKNKILEYKFNHGYFDGHLMEYYIKNNLIEPRIINCKQILELKKYQYLSNTRINNYSIFISSISRLIYKMVKSQNREISIGIVVSDRYKLKNYLKKGIYIKLATFKINKKNTLLEICEIHHSAIQSIKNQKNINNMLSWLKFQNIDYIFNSHRNLSTIKQKNGNTLIKCNNYNKISKNEINMLISEPNKIFITIDYQNKHYIISKINKRIIDKRKTFY